MSYAYRWDWLLMKNSNNHHQPHLLGKQEDGKYQMFSKLSLSWFTVLVYCWILHHSISFSRLLRWSVLIVVRQYSVFLQSEWEVKNTLEQTSWSHNWTITQNPLAQYHFTQLWSVSPSPDAQICSSFHTPGFTQTIPAEYLHDPDARQLYFTNFHPSEW